jgi:putative PIN family toxin of toxin-antitoxin system
VLISAFAFDGTPEKAVKKAFTEGSIYVSPALLAEYRDVPMELENKGKLTHSQFKTLISGIAAVVTTARMVYPKKEIKICRDPKDNMLIECCLEANANVLITGDKDLLEMDGEEFDVKILTPKKFVEE